MSEPVCLLCIIQSGLAPLCENMPSGKATKPGDVVTAKNGKTIQVSELEVTHTDQSVFVYLYTCVQMNKFYCFLHTQVDNTDAEGRLILADALCYGHVFNPRAIVNVATLTGGILVYVSAFKCKCRKNNWIETPLKCGSWSGSFDSGADQTKGLCYSTCDFSMNLRAELPLNPSAVSKLSRRRSYKRHIYLFKDNLITTVRRMHIPVGGFSPGQSENDKLC